MKLGARFDRAFQLAHQIHEGQLRKGTQIPYVTHPLAVCSLVLTHGGSEIEACAALLHDAAEDGGGETALARIERACGPRVASIVRECSDSILPKGEKKMAWRERKEKHLAEIASASPSAKLVMTADKLHNAQSILTDLRRVGPALWERFAGGEAGTLWYYRSVCQALSRGASRTKRSALTDELAHVVANLLTMCNT